MKVMADSKGSGMKSEANSGNYVMEIKGGSKAQPVTSNTDSVMSTVKCDLRSLLVSSKDGILSADLQDEYKQLVGRPLPFQKLKFESLDDFVKSIPDVVEEKCRDEKLYYVAVPHKAAAYDQQPMTKPKEKEKGQRKKDMSGRGQNQPKQGRLPITLPTTAKVSKQSDVQKLKLPPKKAFCMSSTAQSSQTNVLNPLSSVTSVDIEHVFPRAVARLLLFPPTAVKPRSNVSADTGAPRSEAEDTMPQVLLPDTKSIQSQSLASTFPFISKPRAVRRIKRLVRPRPYDRRGGRRNVGVSLMTASSEMDSNRTTDQTGEDFPSNDPSFQTRPEQPEPLPSVSTQQEDLISCTERKGTSSQLQAIPGRETRDMRRSEILSDLRTIMCTSCQHKINKYELDHLLGQSDTYNYNSERHIYPEHCSQNDTSLSPLGFYGGNGYHACNDNLRYQQDILYQRENNEAENHYYGYQGDCRCAYRYCDDYGYWGD